MIGSNVHIPCRGEKETSALAKISVNSLWSYGLMALLAPAASTEFLFFILQLEAVP